MQQLFATAMNLFVSPGAAETLDREKLDSLRKAVDESLRTVVSLDRLSSRLSSHYDDKNEMTSHFQCAFVCLSDF